MLIAYLLPFSYSPVFLLSALTNLDKKSFPRLGRRIAGTLQSRIENGSDPLTALEETSNIIGGNTIIGQLLQSYVRITRTVGQASYATLVFFERAIKAIESSWSKFTMASKVLAEAYIGVWGLILLAFILSLVNPVATGYLALLPFTTLGFLILAAITYIFLQPPIGNPYNGVKQNNVETGINYILIIATLLLVARGRFWEPLLLLISAGVVTEYRFLLVSRSYRKLLNNLAEAVNNVKLGFPARQEIRSIIEKNNVSGGLKNLLLSMERGARQAGDIGFKNALQYIHQLLEHATRKHREALLTTMAFSLILSFMPTLTAHGIDVISALQTNSWQSFIPSINFNQARSLIAPYTIIVPIIPALSIRPRHPPLLLSALSLLLYHFTSSQLLN